jgi:hypothetical protein
MLRAIEQRQRKRARGPGRAADISIPAVSFIHSSFTWIKPPPHASNTTRAR